MPALLPVRRLATRRRPALITVMLLLVAGSLLTALAACGGDDEDSGPPLEGTQWTMIGGVEAPPDAIPTLILEDGLASGFGGCNTYSGGYEVEGQEISLGDIGSTLMACPDAETATEQAYLSALEGTSSWVVENGGLAFLTDGEEVLRFGVE